MVNEGTLERVARVILGAVLLSLVFVGSTSKSAYGWIGIIPLVTGLLGFYPVYRVLGICTCERPDRAGAKLT